MEFDQHKKPEVPGEHKEAKKKKAKKRAPAHVPLPIEERKKVSLEKKKKPEHTELSEPQKVNLRKEKPKEVTRQPVGEERKPVVSSEKPQAAHTEHASQAPEIDRTLPIPEAKSAPEHAPEKVATPHEREVPLHEAVEGEVFVSERLRQDDEPVAEGSAPEDSEQGEHAEDVAESAADKGKDDTRKPRLRQNPQQQQQTQAGSPAGASSTAAGAASSPFLAQWRNRNTGGVPPNNPPLNPNQPPTPPNLPPHNPNLQPFNPNLPSSPNVLPITSQPVSEQVRNRASERRHLVTGLIVGALVEHIRHKRREKRMTKAHTKEVKGLKKEQEGTQLEHRAEQNKQLREKTALEKTIERLEKAAVPFAAVAANKTPEKVMPQKPLLSEQLKATPVKTMEEAKKEFEERARKAVESAREPEEELEVPEDHRIERSAWHAVEVDKKTGKAVEDASFGYGEAFHQEQQQEQFKKPAVVGASAESEAAASASGAAHQANPLMLPPQAPKYPELSSGQSKTEKARERSVELAQDAVHVLGKIQPIDGLLWVILGIIVLIIFKLL